MNIKEALELLTNKQKKILHMGLNRGFITRNDFFLFYASQAGRKEAVMRMMGLGIMYETAESFNKFVINTDLLEDFSLAIQTKL